MAFPEIRRSIPYFRDNSRGRRRYTLPRSTPSALFRPPTSFAISQPLLPMFPLNLHIQLSDPWSRLLSGMLLAAGAFILWGGIAIAEVSAQERGQEGTIAAEEGERTFREWLTGQREGLSRLETFVVEADVEHRVSTSDGERFATYGMTFQRLQDERPSKGALRYLTLNGDTLDVSERRRVERIISSMMTEELGSLLNGLNLPTALLSRVRTLGPAVRLVRDGRTMIRLTFDVLPPPRDQAFTGSRPGRRGGMRPGMRQGSPRGGRPADGRVREGSRPSPRISLFIEEASGRLVMTRIGVDMEGERRLVAETLFDRIEGLDIPRERFVRGDFPTRRRLRTVTVSLDHHTEFRVASLNFGNGN